MSSHTVNDLVQAANRLKSTDLDPAALQFTFNGYQTDDGKLHLRTDCTDDQTTELEVDVTSLNSADVCWQCRQCPLNGRWAVAGWHMQQLAAVLGKNRDPRQKNRQAQVLREVRNTLHDLQDHLPDLPTSMDCYIAAAEPMLEELTQALHKRKAATRQLFEAHHPLVLTVSTDVPPPTCDLSVFGPNWYAVYCAAYETFRKNLRGGSSLAEAQTNSYTTTIAEHHPQPQPVLPNTEELEGKTVDEWPPTDNNWVSTLRRLLEQWAQKLGERWLQLRQADDELVLLPSRGHRLKGARDIADLLWDVHTTTHFEVVVAPATFSAWIRTDEPTVRLHTWPAPDDEGGLAATVATLLADIEDPDDVNLDDIVTAAHAALEQPTTPQQVEQPDEGATQVPAATS